MFCWVSSIIYEYCLVFFIIFVLFVSVFVIVLRLLRYVLFRLFMHKLFHLQIFLQIIPQSFLLFLLPIIFPPLINTIPKNRIKLLAIKKTLIDCLFSFHLLFLNLILIKIIIDTHIPAQIHGRQSVLS